MELLTDCDPLSERDKIIQSLRTEKWACTKPCFYLSAEKKKTNPRQKNWGISVFHWWSRRTWEHQGRPEDFVSVLIYWCWKFEGDGPTALACPAQKDPQIQFFYSEEYFMQLDIHSFLASSSFLSLLLPLAYVNNLFLNKTRTTKKKKVTRLLTSSFQGLKNIILMLTPHRGGHEILHAWPRNLTAAQQEIPGTFHGSSQWNHWINFSGSSAPALVTHECTNHQKTSRTFLSEAPCAGVLQSNACYKFVFFF